MNLLTVVGARPQFIKAAAVSRALSQQPSVHEYLLHTGQHYDANMSDVFFDEMQIKKPDYHLNVSGTTHAAMTADMLLKIENVCTELKPDALMVYGDTNSTLAGALAAAKLNIPVVHVEAGLRSFKMSMPEEINRVLTDRLSRLLFCPTDTAVHNLEKEGFKNFGCDIVKTGDVMYDAALHYSAYSREKAQVFKNLKPGRFVLCTLHRAENTDSQERLQSILSALQVIAEKMQVIIPLHPRTRKKIASYGLSTDGLHIMDPIGYFDILEFLKNSEFVITDSGGLQKEAYFFKKPCVVLRRETEWVELLQEGHVLADADHELIISSAEKIRSHNIGSKPIYGNGDASLLIATTLTRTFA